MGSPADQAIRRCSALGTIGKERPSCVTSVSRDNDDESLGERVFMVLLVALFAVVGALLVILLLHVAAAQVAGLEHPDRPHPIAVHPRALS